MLYVRLRRYLRQEFSNELDMWDEDIVVDVRFSATIPTPALHRWADINNFICFSTTKSNV
jgi:hypothetical protein